MIKKVLVYLPYLILIFTGLYFIFTTSPFVRYWVDDFCSAAFLKENGFWGAQIGWWNSWTGRYSAVFLTDVFETIGPWVVRILPPILLALLIVSVKKIFFGKFIFASLFAILMLINSPNIIQSFYWQTGSLNYTIPFVFLFFFLSWFFIKNEKKKVFLSFLLMFIAGGFSEAFALAGVVLILFLILSLFLINSKDKKKYLAVALAGFLGILTSLVLMSFAPGNTARGLSVTKPENLEFVVKSTLLGTKWFLLRMFSIRSFLYSLLLIFLAVFTFGGKLKVSPKKSLLVAILLFFSMIFTTIAVVGSGFYSMSIIPPERTLFIATTTLLLEFYAGCVFACNLFKNTKLAGHKLTVEFAVIISLIFSILLTKSTYEHWSSVRSEIKTYASAWDKEVKNLPVIHNIKPVGELDSFTDNKGWVSSCLAGYYGLESVKIVE